MLLDSFLLLVQVGYRLLSGEKALGAVDVSFLDTATGGSAPSAMLSEQQLRRAQDGIYALIAQKRFVFIDTNVWMDEAYAESITHCVLRLRGTGHYVVMLSEQFHEIDNLRSSGKDEATRARARHAIRLVDKLTETGCLRKLPRQAQSSDVELPADRWRTSAGV